MAGFFNGFGVPLPLIEKVRLMLLVYPVKELIAGLFS
jgi:hypothetical protein